MKLDEKIKYLVIFAGVALLILFVINQEIGTVHKELEPAPEKQTQNQQNQNPSNYTLLLSKNVCEGCHMSGKTYIPQAESAIPHVNGGAYCLSCHVISHEKHPMNDTITCEKCHGKSPTKPVYSNGNISCNNCHDYPDPLLPSKGNLITIHKPRGIACVNCHTNDCLKCHEEIGTSDRWVKRMEHFKVVAMGK